MATPQDAFPPVDWFGAAPPGAAPADEIQISPEDIAQYGAPDEIQISPEDIAQYGAPDEIQISPEDIALQEEFPPRDWSVMRADEGSAPLPAGPVGVQDAFPPADWFGSPASPVAPPADEIQISPEDIAQYSAPPPPAQPPVEQAGVDAVSGADRAWQPPPEVPAEVPPEEAGLQQVDRKRGEMTAAQIQQVQRSAAALDEADKRDALAADQYDKAAAAHKADMEDFRAKYEAMKNVEPNRLWHNMGTGQKIAALLSAAIGGYLSPWTGGHNVGLETLQRAVDADVDAQKHDLAGQRSDLAAMSGLSGDTAAAARDAARAAEARRLAIYDKVDDELAKVQQSLDAQGTSFMRVAQLRASIAEAKQKAEAAVQHESWEEWKGKAELAISTENAKTARMNAGTEAGKLALSRKEYAEGAPQRAENLVHTTMESAKMARELVTPPPGALEAQKFEAEHALGPAVMFRPAGSGKVEPLRIGGEPSSRGLMAETVASRNALQQGLRQALLVRERLGFERWNLLPKAVQQNIVRAYAGLYGMHRPSDNVNDAAFAAMGGTLGQIRDPSEALHNLSQAADKWADEHLNAYRDPAQGEGTFVWREYETPPPPERKKTLPPIHGDDDLREKLNMIAYGDAAGYRVLGVVAASARDKLPPAALPYLERGLYDKEARVRRAAADALAKHGDPDALAKLDEMVQYDPDDKVGITAVRAANNIRVRYKLESETPIREEIPTELLKDPRKILGETEKLFRLRKEHPEAANYGD